MLVLIDSGASHNFIAKELAAKLVIPVTATASFGVRLGDDHRKLSQGCCKTVQFQLADHQLVNDFFLFELGGVDVSHGIAWLETLREVKTNWKTLTMFFAHNPTEVIARVIPYLLIYILS